MYCISQDIIYIAFQQYNNDYNAEFLALLENYKITHNPTK